MTLNNFYYMKKTRIHFNSRIFLAESTPPPLSTPTKYTPLGSDAALLPDYAWMSANAASTMPVRGKLEPARGELPLSRPRPLLEIWRLEYDRVQGGEERGVSGIFCFLSY